MLNYYGISMGAGGIPGSIYVTFAIGVVAEVIALLLVLPALDRAGRHNRLAFGQLLGGASCLACALATNGTTQAVLAAIGKFGCSVGQPAMLIYTAELLPTNCRSTIMGVCSQASRLGSLVAPFLLMLGNQLGLAGHSQVFFPFMVFGSLAVLGGVLTIFMPETLGAAMPENAEDLDDLLSPFTAKPWRRGILALFAFIFKTKAAYAYKTYQCRECRAHTCTCFNEALLDAAAAAAAGEAAGGEAAGVMGEVIDGANESQDDFDDGVAGTGVSGSAELGGGNACDDASASASADEAAAVVRGTAGSSTSAATSDDSNGKSIAIE